MENRERIPETRQAIFAPVVIFAYKRADHLAKCVQSLLKNPEAENTPLYIYCDGPKTPEEICAVERVREFSSQIRGFFSVTISTRCKNIGLAKSIIDGVNDLLAIHDRLIVVEDDLLLSSHFLRFMNDGLATYENEERVASIHAYCYPVDDELPATFFLRGADCWGWGTWRRAWRFFRTDGAALLAELKQRNLAREFDLDGAYPYMQMLADQVAGRNDSWAVRWHASVFLLDMLTLYPGCSLVQNLGNDSSGTHSKTTTMFDVDLVSTGVRVVPVPILQSSRARDSFARFLRPSFLRRLARMLSKAGSRLPDIPR